MTTIIPGAAAPVCIEDGLVVRVGEAFLTRKPTEPSGVSKGGPLGASLPPFSARRKEVASRPDPFLQGVLKFVRAYKPLS